MNNHYFVNFILFFRNFYNSINLFEINKRIDFINFVFTFIVTLIIIIFINGGFKL